MIYVFFFNDTATTEIYTLSLHDALPISVTAAGVAAGAATATGHRRAALLSGLGWLGGTAELTWTRIAPGDRKSTRLNSSHANISYAVFCLKKKKSQHMTAHSS